MLADFLAWIWPALPYLFAAGGFFILAGALWLFVVRRDDLSLGEPDVPVFIEPVRYPPPLPPKAHTRFEDADTHVVARIPGATPPERITDDELVRAIEGLRHLPAGPELVEFLDAIDADVRELDLAAGPVCPVCGGPWHAVCPSKSAPTQVVDLCPLTTQDIEVPDTAPTPAFDTTVQKADTQELSAALARAKERAA